MTGYLSGWDGTTSPFSIGYLRATASGSDTLIQVDWDASGTNATWQTLVVLQGVAPSALTLANYRWSNQPVNQSLNGTANNDSLVGGDGNDYLYGNAGADTLLGGGGNDNLYGQDGADLLSGGDGRDTLTGGAGNDTLSGDAGDDYFSDYEGANSLSGGDGDDIFDNVSFAGGSSSGGIDTLTGGAGRDTYRLHGSDAYYSPSTLKADIITDFTAGAGGDVLDLTNVYSYLSGRTSGQKPFHQRTSASGPEWLRYARPDGLGRLGITGTWQTLVQLTGVTATSLTAYNIGYNNLPNSYSPTDVGYAITGSSLAEQITGTDSRDTLSGGLGNETLYGQAGDDIVNGGEGSDGLYGGSGNDTLTGGSGNDTLTGDDGNDSLTAGDGDDYLNGNAGADTLLGGGGNDNLSGQEGADLLSGGDGRDTLTGGAGNDTLSGDAGDDYFSDYEGANSLSGGDGDDIFDNVSYAGGSSSGGIDTLTAAPGGIPTGFTALTRIIRPRP